MYTICTMACRRARPHAAALCAYYTVRHVSVALVCERFVLGVMGTMYYCGPSHRRVERAAARRRAMVST